MAWPDPSYWTVPPTTRAGSGMLGPLAYATSEAVPTVMRVANARASRLVNCMLASVPDAAEGVRVMGDFRGCERLESVNGTWEKAVRDACGEGRRTRGRPSVGTRGHELAWRKQNVLDPHRGRACRV